MKKEEQTNWNRSYLLLIVWLCLIIVMLYLFTTYFK